MTRSTVMPIPPQRLAFGRAPDAAAADLVRRIARAQRRIDAAITAGVRDLIPLLELIDEDLARRFAPLRHLNSVATTPAVRASYERALAAMTDFTTWTGQHQGLYRSFHELAKAPRFARRSQAERALVRHALSDFRLSGAALPAARRERVRTLLAELSALGNRFETQVLDATDAWSLHLDDARALAGLPEAVVALLGERAAAAKESGYQVTLDPAVVDAVLTHADSRDLRREVHEAWVSRASDCGPLAGRFDNGPVIEKILACRQALADAVGYPHYAAYRMVERMVTDPRAARAFLRDLAHRALPRARVELAELAAFVRNSGTKDELAPWDLGYWSEKLRTERYGFDEERLRRYLPLPHVLAGLRHLCRTLYGLRIESRRSATAWHPEVQIWRLRDRQGERIGELYLDLYARPGKRGGAWMDEGGSRLRLAGIERRPSAFLSANFLHPASGRPALINHDDLVTLCHELGHCLHHLLTRVDFPSVAGISGVEWDAVEFPSQLHEELAWHPAGLAALAAETGTGAAVPRDLVEALGASRRFQGALRLIRQLEFALFDLDLHRRAAPTPSIADVRNVLTGVRAQVRITPVSAHDRFECGFTHIFGGGYAAGYYSYLWAEVMARDAFAAFTADTTLDPSAGRRLAATVLAAGGSRPAAALFREFRGRDPDPATLLTTYGINVSGG